jgi:hypothetical protein
MTMAAKPTGPGKGRPLSGFDGFLIFNFDIDGDKLKSEHHTFLRRNVVSELKAGASIAIQGITDTTGSDEHNIALSDRRVANVLEFLRKESPNNFTLIGSAGHGEALARGAGIKNNTNDETFRGVIIQIQKASPKPTPQKNIADFIVRFSGVLDNPKRIVPDSVVPDKVIATALKYKALPNRKLHRLGHQTAGFGKATAQIRSDLLDEIRKLRGSDDLGVVCIFGASSGGRNAIEMAQEMDAAGFGVTYLAVSDAAFYPPDARPMTFPKGTTKLPIPAFNAGKITAVETQNFFQTKGNGKEDLLFRNVTIYSSKMDQKEIHGSIDGMTDADLTISIISTDVDEMHRDCSKLAQPKIHDSIVSVLDRADTLTKKP